MFCSRSQPQLHPLKTSECRCHYQTLDTWRRDWFPESSYTDEGTETCRTCCHALYAKIQCMCLIPPYHLSDHLYRVLELSPLMTTILHQLLERLLNSASKLFVFLYSSIQCTDVSLGYIWWSITRLYQQTQCKVPSGYSSFISDEAGLHPTRNGIYIRAHVSPEELLGQRNGILLLVFYLLSFWDM